MLLRNTMLRVLRIVASSASSLVGHASSTSADAAVKRSFATTLSAWHSLQNQAEKAIPGETVKWGLLGFFRISRFATGFTPFQPKPLDSIVDIERAKDRSAEDIASIWDDYHLGRGHIGASMKAKLYHLLEQTAADCWYFVIASWWGSGYTTMFV